MTSKTVCSFYSGIIRTKTGRIKKTWPKVNDPNGQYDGDVLLDKMSEEGERCLAQTLQDWLKGRLDDPLDLELDLDPNVEYIPLTTRQLLEYGMMTKEDEEYIQDKGGIDVIIIPFQMFKDRTLITVDYVREHTDWCFQSKLQLRALRYKAITTEAFTDVHYNRNKKLDLTKADFLPSGLNKCSAKWTAYIVCGGTILFMKTQELREVMYEKELKYIGNVWNKGNVVKRNVGNATLIHPLLSTGVAQPVSVNEVFRTYFSQLTDAHLTDGATEQDFHWELFVQDWTVNTLKTFLAGSISAVDETLIRGKKYAY